MIIAQAPAASRPVISERITSLDIVRGVVMVLMAIDHVRVYSGVPAGGPSPGIFFTRWVTHFCAPAFVFFAGTAAYLRGTRLPGNGETLPRYLLTRGLLLIVLELTLIRLSWTFSVATLLVWRLRDGAAGADRFSLAPYVNIPAEDQWSLLLLYAVFAADVVMLYFACRWYASLKARHPNGWLRYL